ncbi:regulatory protein RecX [Anoxynatronum buryatiense]|uniref:Regulatory protein RecX n=1 Tax=Anoxynatronum buryatiense TaxID=489973 RepID=A0AA45WUN7_9CLOT|nr:RecX family transcriptional regulator [Anoxynatronum buryatiense]SMP48398.1 SOS response regulatory protein OraA/RecX, interacts with RecA [Anoxynatronum buryatiense]
MKKKPEAISAALNYLSYQSRTRQEMEKYLKIKEYTPKEITETLSRLSDYGYINDESFTRRVSEMTMQHPLKGKNSLPGKLARKGIDDELIQQAMEVYDEKEDEKKALALARKFMLSALDMPLRKNLDQLTRKLFSRGFTSDVIYRVIKEMERDESLVKAREDAEPALYDHALALAEKTLQRWEAKEPEEPMLRRRMMQSLYQRGYETDISRRAVEDVLSSWLKKRY